MASRGYTIFESAFSIAEMKELDENLAAFEAGLQREGLDTREVVFTQKIAERDENIRAFALREEFVALSTAFLGPNTDLYYNQKVYKNPSGTKSFGWHQDDAYGPVEPSPYLTLWIAITDATPENGCISVLPGSHHQGLVLHRNGDFGLECHSHDDSDQGVIVPVSAGSVICFWSLLMHKSGPNLTNDVRKAIVLQFSPEGLRHKASGMAIRPKVSIARNGFAVIP
jgi:ectoine hydroxylase-related dioxygenase (phytanoyl-CoA dioxygenase family)